MGVAGQGESHLGGERNSSAGSMFHQARPPQPSDVPESGGVPLLELHGTRVLVRVDDTGARYPLHIDQSCGTGRQT
jgi:hypothetical protein